MVNVALNCSYCDEELYRNLNHATENINLGYKSYCSTDCLSTNRKRRKQIQCENPKCGKLFERIISGISAHNYCSRSCSVSVNNTKFPKNPAVRKTCAFCHKTFISREKYCSVNCKNQDHTMPAETILERIKLFHHTYKRIPLKREFTHTKAARDRFGSWNKAIIAAGFTPNPVMFANKHIAKDGHKCDSLAEKIIDDWLYARKIAHQRTIPYPGNPTLTVDFVIGENWIEFFGLRGEHRRYDELREEKLQLAKSFNLNLIELYPEHLFPKNTLSKTLAAFL
jgi:hypothetical protein